MASRLNISAIEAIKADPILFGLVAQTLRIKPTSLMGTLSRNTSRHLTKDDVLKVLSDYTGKEAVEFIEDYSDELMQQDTN